MADQSQGQITQLLDAVGRGEGDAVDRLWALIYEELRGLARHQMAAEPPGKTLQPTALVHEAYLRLFGDSGGSFANRKHFFAAAARAMRCIRTDDARRRNRQKRGGDGGVRSEGTGPGGCSASDLGRVHSAARLPVEDVAAFDQDPAELLAVDEALGRLEREDPRKAKVVEMRYFVGLTIEETAEVLDVSPRTVDSDWRFARAWLHDALGE